MKRRVALMTVFAVVFGYSISRGEDFWTKPFEKWNRNQVMKLLEDSPWAQTQTNTLVLGSRDAGLHGERELFYKFTVRFFSALPVREAFVRMYQLMNNYDELDPQRRQEFDSRFKRALDLDVHDRVIVAVEMASNDPEANRNLKQALDTSRTQEMKQNCFLISQHLGRVELLEYYPPSPDGTGAKFIFPRLVEGKPVVDPGDKEVRFEFYVPAVDQKLFVNFKIPKMSYQGQLTY